MKNVLESKIESYLKQQIARTGGLCYKWKSTVNGVPDQIVIFEGATYFIEVKRPGEEPRANQVHVHNQINKRGVAVYTVSTENEVDEFVRDVLGVNIADLNHTPTKETGVIKSSNAFKLD